MARKRTVDGEEGKPHRIYGCLKCGGACYFTEMKIGENYEPCNFRHVNHDTDRDHPATPIPKIEGVNVKLGKVMREVEMRECGYCAHPIHRSSPFDPWQHAQWGKRKLNFDHQAKIDRPSHEECMAYRQKFQMMVHADGFENRALGLTPISHFVSAAK